jgi:hypothetical protein
MITISNITPLTGYDYGGNTVVITGTGFDNTCTVFFGNVQAAETRIDSATQITVIAPFMPIGPYNITVNSVTNSIIYDIPFVFYAPAIYKPERKFTTYLNGNDVSQYVIKQPIVKTELNILIKWDIAFDEVAITLPDELEDYLKNNSNDRIEVKDNSGGIAFLGFIKNKDRDRAAHKINITSSPLFSLVSKKTGPFTATSAQNAMKNLYALLVACVPTGFYIDKKIAAIELPGIDFYINSSDNLNYMSTAMSICQTCGIGLYLDGNIIKAKLINQFPKTAQPMTLLKQSVYQERQYLNYNKITVKYKTSPGASEQTATTQLTDVFDVLEFVVTPSSMFFTSTAAQALSDRLLSIYSYLFYEADFVVNADNVVSVGDYFQPEIGYVFFVMTKEETPLQIKIHGIGVKTT